MGQGPQYVIAQLNSDNVPVPVGVDNPLKISGGGGGGAVDSVNGKTGAVELTAGDVSAVPNQDGAGNAYRAYIVNQAGNNATLILEGMNPLPTTIVVRTGTGAVVTGTPTEDNHASTKAYVDDAVSGFNASLVVLNNSIAAIYEVPEPPATGNYRLESVDGVAQWVENL